MTKIREKNYRNFVSKVVHISPISGNPLGIDFLLRKHKLNPTVLYNKYKPILEMVIVRVTIILVFTMGIVK